jgi:hypothetical protein
MQKMAPKNFHNIIFKDDTGRHLDLQFQKKKNQKNIICHCRYYKVRKGNNLISGVNGKTLQSKEIFLKNGEQSLVKKM